MGRPHLLTAFLPRPRRGTVAWLVAVSLVPVVLLCVCIDGIYRDPSPTPILLVAFASLVAEGLTLQRDHLSELLSARTGGFHPTMRAMVWALRDALLVVAAAGLSYLALEAPLNSGRPSIEPVGTTLELLVIGTTMLVGYFLAQRRGWLAAIVPVLAFLAGIGQYFTLALKQTVVMPGDLYALGTAAAVSGGLTFRLTPATLPSLAHLALALACLALVVPPKALPESSPDGRGTPASSPAPRPALGAAPRPALNLACAAALALCLPVEAGATCDWVGRQGIDYWFIVETYQRYGSLNSFMTIARDMGIKAPDGYSDAQARQLEQEGAAGFDAGPAAPTYAQASSQFSATRPTVIAIMNETFSDLSLYQALSDQGYAGPTAFNAIPDALARGVLYTSVLGGGTCNSEFEFLSGNTMAFVGPGKYPYTLYDLSGIPTLARQFKELGYTTCAIHPNLATNWNRDRVYRGFGFDRFLDIGSFEHAPQFHNGVTDGATYDKVLELLAADDGPQFIFDVTMQNHAGYDLSNIPADRLTSYRLDRFSDYDNAQLNEYLSCIQASDEDLAAFVARLRDLDRPVVLVFFGDHQPTVSSWLNDSYHPGEDELAHSVRSYQTSYVIWANYDVVGNGQTSQAMDTSVNYLGALMNQMIGAPLTDYQKAELSLRETLPGVTLNGYRDASGAWHAPTKGDEGDAATDAEESCATEAARAYDLFERLEYYEFGSRV